MRIKELIRRLQKIEREHGDIPVFTDELGEPMNPDQITVTYINISPDSGGRYTFPDETKGEVGEPALFI